MACIELRSVLLMTLMAVTGCSGLKVHNASSDGTSGIPIYEPVPYLLVKNDGTSEFVTLPGKVVAFVDPQAGMGSLQWSFKQGANGMLTEVSATGDSQLDELITAVASLIPTLYKVPDPGVKSQQSNQNQTFGLAPGLYRIDPKTGTWSKHQ